MRPLLAALAVVLLAGCAGSGVPKAERSPLLEKAKAAGIIDHYYVLHRNRACGVTSAYGVDEGEVAIRIGFVSGGGVGYCSGPAPASGPMLEIWYTREGHDKGLALWRLAGWGHRIECGPGCVPEQEASRR